MWSFTPFLVVGLIYIMGKAIKCPASGVCVVQAAGGEHPALTDN